MEILQHNFALILPIIIIQLGLQIFSLIKLFKASSVTSLGKPIWAFIIVIGGVLGSMIFLILKPYEE